MCEQCAFLKVEFNEALRKQKAQIAELESQLDRTARTCPACGKAFYAARMDAIFCSRNCKCRGAYRRRMNKKAQVESFPWD